MKFKECGIVIFSMVILGILLYAVVRSIFPSIEADNAVEQEIERVIEFQTGIDIDLSP